LCPFVFHSAFLLKLNFPSSHWAKIAKLLLKNFFVKPAVNLSLQLVFIYFWHQINCNDPMKQTITILFFLLLTGIFNSVSARQAVRNNIIERQCLVQLRHSADLNRLLSDYNDFGLYKIRTVSERFHVFLLGISQGRVSAQSVINALKLEKAVLNVQHNHKVKLRDNGSINELIPNDSLFGYQWALKNTGQNGGKWDADIDATDAWDITTGGLTAQGDTIVLAIIDGGTDLFHEDLDFWKNRAEIPNNNIDDDSNGYVDDYDGWNAYDHNGDIPFHNHGVHVSGIAGAIGNNDVGISGVNWHVKILPVAGSSTSEATVVEALSYVYTVRERYDQTNGQEGAFVVADNCSFGVDLGQPEDYPIWEAMYDSLGQLGILSVAATANRAWDIDSVGDVPTGFTTDYMISVTNTTKLDVLYGLAAYGDTTIDLGAPGSLILSLRIGNNYGNSSGTSMATPHVTGSVALMMAAADSAFMVNYKNNPAEAILEIKGFILDGVDTLPTLEGKTVSGGRLNVFNAINLLLNAPSLSVDKDSVYVEMPMNSTLSEDLIVSNTGGDTIFYSVALDGEPGWLSLNQTEGVLPSEELDTLVLTFNSNDLDTGVYQSALIISGDNIVTRTIPVTLFIYNNVGIDDFYNKNTQISVYPNPFSSFVRFSFKGYANKVVAVDIFNQTGEKVFAKNIYLNQPGQQIKWTGKTPGFYFYRISINQKVVKSGKLIKL